MDRANDEVLTVLERDVLHPDVTKTVVPKALDKFRASERERTERRQVLHKQIAAIDLELKRLVAAISSGGDIPALVDAVKTANEQKTALSQNLAEVDSQQHSDADYDRLEKDLQAHFESTWKTMLTRRVGPTRQILRKLFNETRVPFTPACDKAEKDQVEERNLSMGGLIEEGLKDARL